MAALAVLKDRTQSPLATIRIDDSRVVDLDPTRVVTLGSKRDNTIALNGEGVSRYHAELVYAEDQWWVRDLAARNGVWVDEQQIVGEQALSSGDSFKIGRQILRLEIRRRPISARLLDLGRETLADRRKLGAACVGAVVAVAGLVCLLQSPAEPIVGPDPGLSQSLDLAEGCAELTAGRYIEARTIFRRVKVLLPNSKQRLPRLLEQIADRWANLEKEDGPRRFRWERAAALLERCEGVDGLPSDLTRWIKGQHRFLAMNQKSLETLKQAKLELTRAEELADTGDVDDSLVAYRAAQSLYRRIPKGALFAAEAETAADELTHAAFDRLTGIVRHSMRRVEPDWNDLLETIESFRTMASGPQDHRELRRLYAGCEQNRVDQQLYDRASVFMRRGDEPLRVIELLSQVRPDSAVFSKAQLYLDQLQVGALLTQAHELYASGAGEAALRVLSALLANPHLATSERDRLRDERMRWGRVVAVHERTWDQEQELKEEEEITELQRLLELEPDPQNFFHRSAREQLQTIQCRQSERFKNAFRDGRSAMETGDFGLALEVFERIDKDMAVSERQLELVRSVVEAFEERTRLADRSKRLLFEDDRWAFPKLCRAFALLSAWLPKGPKRAEAARSLRSVEARLAALRLADQ